MTKETITILTLSKGRMKAEAEKVFKKNKLKSIVELYAESGKWDYWSIED